MEEVLFETESRQSRAEIAATLRQVADNLEAGEPTTLAAGGESIEVSPADPAEFEVKVEREGPADGGGELSVEFEIEWNVDGGDDELSVE